jgi:hypothetical protein
MNHMGAIERWRESGASVIHSQVEASKGAPGTNNAASFARKAP